MTVLRSLSRVVADAAKDKQHTSGAVEIEEKIGRPSAWVVEWLGARLAVQFRTFNLD